MARYRLIAMALLGVLALSSASLQAAAVDDLSVKMWYPDDVRRGQSSGVSLEIRNENYDYPVNISWTGINVDWMAPGSFASNTSQFILRGGQSRIVNLTFEVPGDAKAGKHSNYEVVNYALKNGTNGEWTEATWESVITSDFNVIVDQKASGDWYSWATDNSSCLCGALIVLVIIGGVAIAARRRIGRGRIFSPSRDIGFKVRPSASPPPEYAERPFPPAPYEETPAAAPAEPAPEPTPEIEPEAPPIPEPPAPPVPPREPEVVAMSPPPRDRDVDLMTPTDWDKVGASKYPYSSPARSPSPDSRPPTPEDSSILPKSSSPRQPSVASGPDSRAPSQASPDMGPKFCTYCGAAEPGPVCRNCGRRLI